MEQKLSNLNEVDEMVVFIVGTDGGEELFERSLLSGGELPGCHVKSCFSHLLEEGILRFVILPLDLMSAYLNMYICCPGGDEFSVFFDVVHLGHSEGVVPGVEVWVGIEGESDIIHCRHRCLLNLFYVRVDRSEDVSFLKTRVIASSGDVNSLHHLPSLLGDEGEIR